MSPALETSRLFALLNREVWIVTAAAEQRRGGLLATWVSQASLDNERPVVVVGLAPNHFTAELVDRAGAFALHLLREEQTDVGLNFALGSSRQRDKFKQAPSVAGETGAPLLCDCLARCECRVFHKLAAGDRNYYWADVLHAEVLSNGQPLREAQLIAAASDEQKQQLKQNRLDDILLQSLAVLDWRRDLQSGQQ